METSEFVYFSDRYCRNSHAYFYKNDRGNLLQVTNFFVVSIAQRKEIKPDDSETWYYIVKLRNCYGAETEFEVAQDQLNKIATIIENKVRGFHIFSDRIPLAKEKFKMIFGLVLDEVLRSGKMWTYISYSRWCWSEKLPDGSRRLYHGGLSNCKSDKVLMIRIANEQEHIAFLCKGIEIIHSGDHDVTLPIFVHALSAYALPIFEDAEFPMRHTVMLIGNSGFKKTAFASLFAKIFSTDSVINSVRITDAALNSLLVEKCDDLILLDDFNAEGSRAEINEKSRIARNAIRSVSDGNIRSKCDKYGNVKKSKIRTLVLITGETRMTGQLASSELRYIKIPMNRPFDGRVLLKFQQNSNLLKYLFSDWIRFLESNYCDCVNFIRENFPILCANSSSEGRLNDCAVAMRLVAQIFSEFMLSYCINWSSQINENFYSYFSRIITGIIHNQNADATLTQTHILYLSELFNLIGVGKLVIAPNIDIYLTHQNSFVGYRDGQIIMLERDRAYAEILAAYSARNEFFPASSDEVAKALKEHKLTITDSGSNLKKASSRIAGRPRMLALIESQCQNLFDSMM